MLDIPYAQEQQQIQQIAISNAKNNNDQRRFWSVSAWGGEIFTIPQTSNSQMYGSACINIIPEITHVSKSPGVEAVGFFRDVDPSDGNHESLMCGTVNIKRKGRYIFQFMYDRSAGVSDFYIIEDNESGLGANRGFWQKKNPNTSGYTSNEYRFKGKKFDYVQYKELLLICSGEESFTDSNNITSGLLAFNLITNEWMAIECGKSAKKDLSQSSKRIEDILIDPNKYIDTLEDFNPSIIEEYKDRILISGADGNPYQVKVSEHMNPRNFVDGVIGFTGQPLTAEDNRRASTFFVNEEVLSLTKFGDNVYVGVEDKFYVYSLTSSGTNIELDRLSPDLSSNSGPVSNKVCKVFRGNFYYASNFQIIPELNARALEYRTSFTGNQYTIATSPQKLTYYLDEKLKKCDITNSAIGIYKDSVFWSVNYCDQFGHNNLTFIYRKIGDNFAFGEIEYIKANYFTENGNRGLLYSSSKDGNVYLVREDINYIDNHSAFIPELAEDAYTPNPLQYQGVYQTGLIGVAKGDTAFSQKKLDTLFLEGGFANNTNMIIEVFGVGSICGGEQSCSQPIYRRELAIQYSQQESDSSCGDDNSCSECEMLSNLTFYRNVRYFKKFLKIPVGDSPKLYNELYIRITLDNSANFFISRISGIYTILNPLDESLLLSSSQLGEGDFVIFGDGTENIYYSTTCEICSV